MYTKSAVEKLSHLLVSRFTYTPTEKAELRVILTTEIIYRPLRHCGFFQCKSCLHRFLPGMNKHHHLMAFSDKFRHLFESDIIEVLPWLRRIGFAFDPDEVLLQWYRSEWWIKEEQASMTWDTDIIVKSWTTSHEIKITTNLKNSATSR